MSRVKEAIEEMIEESYLLGLSEDEIRRDFSHFIDTCYTVIHAHVRDRAAVSGLAEDLAREKTCILIADRTQAGRADSLPEEGVHEAVQEPQEAFAEKVARRKRLILKAIADFDPQLVRLIDEQRFQVDSSEVRRPRFKLKRQHDWERYRLLLLKAGYATTVVLIILLIYLGFAQRP
jgi:hypothetical protein